MLHIILNKERGGSRAIHFLRRGLGGYSMELEYPRGSLVEFPHLMDTVARRLYVYCGLGVITSS